MAVKDAIAAAGAAAVAAEVGLGAGASAAATLLTIDEAKTTAIDAAAMNLSFIDAAIFYNKMIFFFFFFFDERGCCRFWGSEERLSWFI